MKSLWWDSKPSSSTTPGSSIRDRDLISTDEHLTNDTLDDLWTWYQSATKDGVDPQLVFVKLINSVNIFLMFEWSWDGVGNYTVMCKKY